MTCYDGSVFRWFSVMKSTFYKYKILWWFSMWQIKSCPSCKEIRILGEESRCKGPVVTELQNGSTWCGLNGWHGLDSVQFSSIDQSCPTLYNPMKCSTPGLPVHHQLPESTQSHVPRVSDAIQPSHPLLSPSPPALNLSKHQGLFQWVISSHQVAKVLEFQLQHQSFHWTPRTDLL